MLALGLGAQTSTCIFLYGLASLVPLLRSPGEVAAGGLSLGSAGAVVAAPSVGLLLTLIAWGATADRYGERLVIAAGMAIAAIGLLAAARSHGLVPLCALLLLAGAGAASVNAASGRMILGWFDTDQRGLAMGIRQTAVPLGVGAAALILPAAGRAGGAHVALLAPAALCTVFAVLIVTLAPDPPRPVQGPGPGTASPYRDPVLWRIHAASAALVVPQFAVSVFTLAYLVSERRWTAIDAGRLVFGMQLAGAAGRIVAGLWSDRVRSRLRPMRLLAVASAVSMVAIAVADLSHSALVIVAFGCAAVITVADNGLAYTSVAELAGPSWTGRALGVQNTGQNIAGALTPPVFGWLVQGHGYATAFAIAAVFPCVAVVIIPVRLAETRAQQRS